MSVKIKQCRRCLTSHLNRIYNGHNQKCCRLYNHSPTNIEAGDCNFMLVSPVSILVGEWLQMQRHFWAWPLYVWAKWDVRHHLHCLVLTDTYLYNLTEEKTYHVYQRWRHTTCLQHPCFDVGCYPWIFPSFCRIVFEKSCMFIWIWLVVNVT